MGAEVRESASTTVQALYTELARHPGKQFGWATGKSNAETLGYEPRWLAALPDAVWASACAVGNPFSVAVLAAGEIVVDLGCGAGADLCIAAMMVGGRGYAIGVDLTPAMVEKAKVNATLANLCNVAVQVADIAALPLGDACADVVLSNGAINLSEHKPCVFKEAFRVLKPGGRFYFADMVRAAGGDTTTRESWANCVAGTVAPERYVEMLRTAGFCDAELVSFTAYKTAPTTVGALFRAHKPHGSRAR